MIEMQSLSNIFNILPELFLAFSSLCLITIGAIFKEKVQNIISLLTIMIFIATIYILVVVIGIDETYAFDDLYYSNAFVVFSKILILASAVVILILQMGQKYPVTSMMGSFEFPIILLLAVIGMMVMISSNDFLTLYLGLEMQSLCLYIMAAFERKNLKSNEAGLKYFILGALATGIFLYGMSLIYGFSGTTNFGNIEGMFEAGVTAENTAVGFIVGMVFIIVGFCFKVAAAPFHMWSPDVYEGSPTIVTASFATLPKIAAITIFARVLIEPFSPFANEWKQIIYLVSVLSMFIGAFGAIRQNNIKRLLAFSSMGHVGYLLMGIAADSQEGIISILFYITLYIIMTLGVFAIIFMMKKKGEFIEDVSSLKGLSKTRPVMAIMMAILMFSMAGVPPFAGFYAKFYIYKAVIGADLYWLAITGVVASIISTFYYLRIVKYIYIDDAEISFDEASLSVYGVASFSALVNLLYFLVPSALINLVFFAISGI